MSRILLFVLALVSLQVNAQKAYTISNKTPSGWAPIAYGEVNIHTDFINNATLSGDTSFHISLISTNMPAGWLLGICSDASCFTVNPGFSEDYFTAKGKTTDFKCTFSFGTTPGIGSARFLVYRAGMQSQGDTITFTGKAAATGMSASARQLSVNVSPNPVKNELSLTLSDNNISGMSIINLVGREVMVLDPKAGKTFDVSSLPNGIYFLRISKGDQSFNQKFIISK